VRIVNDRPLTTVSSHPNDLNPISPSSFLGQQLAPNTPVSAFNERGDLRRDYVYNTTLALISFGKPGSKVTSRPYKDEKSGVFTRQNLIPGQLVQTADPGDITKRGAYRLGRVHCVHPQLRKGKEIVRRATIEVLKSNGSGEIEYLLRDLSKIAPV